MKEYRKANKADRDGGFRNPTSRSLLIITCLAIVFSGCSPRQPQEKVGASDLLIEVKDLSAQLVAQYQGATSARAQLVRLNREALKNLGAKTGGKIQFNLFEDAKYTGEVRDFSPSFDDSQTWSGDIQFNGLPGTFIVVSHKDVVMASVRVPSYGDFEISPAVNDLYVVRQIDASKLQECGVGKEQEVRLPEQPARFLADDGSMIDILILYTTDARVQQGGKPNIETLITQCVKETNTAFEKSKVTTRVKLKYQGEISYTESGVLKTDLARLVDKNDDFLKEAHSLRDTHKADLVCLIVAKGDFGGIARLMKTLSSSFESEAFSVVKADSASSGLSFGHELAHNMGCGHDLKAPEPGPGLYLFSSGWHFNYSSNQYRTMMAYPPGGRLMYFSNPDVKFVDVPTGSVNANNALTINNVAKTVANFRSSQ